MRKIFMCVLMSLTLLNVAAPDLSVFADEKVTKFTAGITIVKEIFVKNKIYNIVVK